MAGGVHTEQGERLWGSNARMSLARCPLLSSAGRPHMLCRLQHRPEKLPVSPPMSQGPSLAHTVLKHWTLSAASIRRTCEVSVGHRSQAPAQSPRPTLPSTSLAAANHVLPPSRAGLGTWSTRHVGSLPQKLQHKSFSLLFFIP